MKTLSIALVVALSISTGASMATAYEPITRYPDPGFSWHRHSSTVAESHLRGTADLVRAIGEANVNNSIAAINNQEALRRGLENSVKYAETYYAKRELYKNYQESYRPRASMEQAKRVASYGRPDRLSPHQFHSATSTLHWPSLFQTNVFGDLRSQIEKLMKERTPANSGRGSDTHAQVASLVKEMEDTLSYIAQHRDLMTVQIVEAKKFLTSLEYEAGFAAEINGLALAD